MEDKALKKEVVDHLNRLGSDQQRFVLQFIQKLEHSPGDRAGSGVPGNRLLEYAGIFGETDLSEIASAIEDGCEKVNMNEW